MDESTLFWIALACQFAGLAAMFATRLGQPIVEPRLGRTLFLAALILVGGCLAVTFCCQGGGWLMTGVTLSAMAVGATLDLSPATESIGF